LKISPFFTIVSFAEAYGISESMGMVLLGRIENADFALIWTNFFKRTMLSERTFCGKVSKFFHLYFRGSSLCVHKCVEGTDTRFINQSNHYLQLESFNCRAVDGMGWAPTRRLKDVVWGLNSLFDDLLNFDDPLNIEAADNFMTDRESFRTKVRDWIGKYAKR
jgi:hypothetical protein